MFAKISRPPNRGAGSGRVGSPIHFFDLILNNAPALRAGNHFNFKMKSDLTRVGIQTNVFFSEVTTGYFLELSRDV